MDYRLEKIVFICCCLAGVASSFPIHSPQVGEQKTLIFGVLAFISVGAFLGACVCCRRRKRGFEEFENESGVLEPARTEYPIFRAISSPERINPQNESIIQAANAHIIAINENNIQIDEEVDNNNGLLSPADMENIENNNAVDYIPNRNEIERLMEPVQISFQQEGRQPPPIFDQSNPFNEQIRNSAYNVAHTNPNNPFVNVINNENYANIADGNQYHQDPNCQITSAAKLLDEAVSLESSLSDNQISDVNSVEEALRALDIAISGEESFLQPNDDEFESDSNEGVKSSLYYTANDYLINNDAKDIGNKATNVYDSEYIEDVRKEAELLVNYIIEESKERISHGLVPTDIVINQNYDNFVEDDVIGSNIFRGSIGTTETKRDRFESCPSDQENLTRDLQSVGSVENLCFENIVLDASTPFVKSKAGKVQKYFSTDSPCLGHSPVVANATFDIETDDVFEGPCITDIKKMDETCTISPLESKTHAVQLCSVFREMDAPVTSEKMNEEQYAHSASFINSHPANTTFDIQHKETEAAKALDETFQLPDKNAINATFTNADATFAKEPEELPKTQPDCPTIKIDKEDTTSVDMTTVTPVNTPIELNYSLDSWDKFISNSMSQQLVMPKNFVEMQPCTSAQAAYAEAANTSGWFLHSKTDDPPPTNDTFDVEEEYEENMDDTFDALRKQLIIMLPHAQGDRITEHPPDFSDDDDDDDDDTDEKAEQRSPSDNTTEPQTEMVINYKRPLSPIMEESEDETCKTFVMNETKNLDSTSTGCVETGEAIMGVTKTLMASNDTLFNFEDTFGDDVFSPRTNSQNDIIKDKVNHPDSSGASTPTPRSFKPIEFETNEVCNVNDLLSPDQQKTLSEDICTVEHLSSDAVDTTFTTNTLEEKTCISVYIKEDEKISEISEPDWGSSNQYDLNSLNDVPSIDVNGPSIEVLDNEDEQTQCNDIEIDESSSTVSIPKKDEKNEEDHPNCDILPSFHHNDDDDSHKDKTTNFLLNEINYSSSHYTKSSDIKPVIYDNVKENTDPNSKQQYDGVDTATKNDDDIMLLGKSLAESGIFEGDLLCETDVIMQNNTFHPDDITIDLNKHHSIIPHFTLCEIDTQGDQNCVMVATEIINQLSGEEDPWAHSISDIRFTGPCAEIMSTSFTGNEWDSDVDDSNSSEEFMYVKGTPPKVTSPELYKQKQQKHDNNGLVPVIVEEDICSVWKSHEDKVPVSVTEIVDTDLGQYEDEDSSSDAEGEWVPSCWDSLAQPSRSALKSPDKSSSEEDASGSPKKRRNVAFKKQNYHSVYEYPKEVVSLSPSYSEPQLWARDLNDLFDKSTEPIDVNVTETEGFSVSSSTRPFHGSQFNAQCHTWPTDSNFSWSQIQDNESNNDKYPSYSELQIKWPKDLKDFFCSEETQDNTERDLVRPDSGVGESAELLSDSVTLGDLCHTKASLRLPLHNVPVPALITGETKKITNLLNDQSIDHNNLILPTPSCTGSMDSLSSSSGSERQISFSTFGKSTSVSLDDDRINESDCKSELVTDDEKQLDNECPIIKLDNDRSTKQNDSTDEDSGIESIMRIASEKI